MYKICIVDDEAAARDRLEELLGQYARESGAAAFDIRQFDCAASYLSVGDADSDIIFLDVDMPAMNGMELAKKIRETRPDVIIIFCTNLQQFAVNGYEVNAFGFIVKPVQWYSFQMYLERAVKRLQHEDGGGGL